MDASELVCTECKRPWLDMTDRWHAYVSEEGTPEVGFFCPACAEREFADDS
jgi:hypothetical protein